MDRRTFLRRTGEAAALCCLGGCTQWMGRTVEAHRDRPNVVIIFTDDQGYGDLGCYGATGFATPNIDRLARQGMRFTDFYVAQAVCSASRAALLTGCYSNRVGILGALAPWYDIGINADETTIAEMLKPRGYVCGIFGKWHLGHQQQFLPLQNGFDEYFGLPYSNDMWPVGFDGQPVDPDNPGEYARLLRYPPLPLIEGNQTIGYIRTLSDQNTLTARYTSHAVDFIERHKDEPFFLYVPHSMPHVPLGVSDHFRGLSAQGKFGDVIMEIDWSVGRIMDTLDRLGLADNTLVIFASDNGPWLNFGNHAGSAGPLREGKGTMWDGGARVPCIMRWPGHIAPGSECRQLAASIDIFPTIAAITGARLPEHPIDGQSMLPLLTGELGSHGRDHYFFYYGRELRAVRQGQWKLVFPHKYRSYVGVTPGRDGWPGKYGEGESGLELYDLSRDIGEKNNVIDQHPDIVAQLSALAEIARADLGDALTKREGTGVRPPGHVDQ